MSKSNKRVLSFAVLALGISSVGFSGELQSTKKAPEGISLKDFSGSLTFGHNNNTKFDETQKDRISGTDVYLSAALNLGLSTFGGKVRYGLGMSYKMNDGTTNLQSNQPYASVNIDAWSGDYGSLAVYASYSPQFNNSSPSGTPGVTYSFPSFKLKDINISSSVSLETVIYGSENVVDAKPSNGSTNEEDIVKVTQNDLEYTANFYVGGSYSIKQVKGLSTGLSATYVNSYKPQYTYEKQAFFAAKDTVPVNVTYKSTGSSNAKVFLNYKISDRFNLNTALVYRSTDLFGRPVNGGSRFINATRLSITLF